MYSPPCYVPASKPRSKTYHLNGEGVAVCIAEDSSDIDLTTGSIDDRNGGRHGWAKPDKNNYATYQEKIKRDNRRSNLGSKLEPELKFQVSNLEPGSLKLRNSELGQAKIFFINSLILENLKSHQIKSLSIT